MSGIEQRLVEMHRRGYPRTRAAELLGVTRPSLDAMIEALCLDWPVGRRVRMFEIDGVNDTIYAHAALLGIPAKTLYWRMLRHGDPHRSRPAAVTDAEARQFLELRGRGVAAWDAANRVGRPYNTLRLACKERFPEYDAVVAAAPRVRRCFRLSDLRDSDEY